MQRTKMVNEARPRRGVQVVQPIATGRVRMIALIAGLLLAVLSGATGFLLTTNNSAAGSLWQHSFLPLVAVVSALNAIGFVFPSSASKVLDKKRQQAARYNMTVGAWERALAHTRPGVPDLPASLTIARERSWPATLASAIIGSAIAGIAGKIVYDNWMQTLPLVQQGMPLFWIIVNTCVNAAFFLSIVIILLYSLISSPRQQLTATHEGLYCRLGRRTGFIPWQQANLFAVIDQIEKRGQQPALIYELASKDTIIRWPSTNTPVYVDWRKGLVMHVFLSGSLIRRSPAVAFEFEQQIQMLNIIVNERSGLPLYDLR